MNWLTEMSPAPARTFLSTAAAIEQKADLPGVSDTRKADDRRTRRSLFFRPWLFFISLTNTPETGQRFRPAPPTRGESSKPPGWRRSPAECRLDPERRVGGWARL